MQFNFYKDLFQSKETIATEEFRYSSLIQNHAKISEQNKEKLASEFKLSELKNAIRTLKNITPQAQMASLINF